MRKFKFYVSAILLGMASISFCACGDDDDDEKTPNNNEGGTTQNDETNKNAEDEPSVNPNTDPSEKNDEETTVVENALMGNWTLNESESKTTINDEDATGYETMAQALLGPSFSIKNMVNFIGSNVVFGENTIVADGKEGTYKTNGDKLSVTFNFDNGPATFEDDTDLAPIIALQMPSMVNNINGTLNTLNYTATSTQLTILITANISVLLPGQTTAISMSVKGSYVYDK